MKSRSRLFRCVIGVLLASVGLWSMACGEDEPTPIISDQNECGGESTLTYDDEEAEPGDACGECGELECDGEEALTCNDPGENLCGGCQELEGEPGDECTTDSGATGQWSCDGEDAVQCETGDLNACGGNAELDAEPGDDCGPCSLDTYRCDGINDLSCSNEIGCPIPSDVSATRGEHSDSVVVTWRGSIYAEGYRVFRDDEEIAELSAGQLSYVDENADPAGAPEEIDVEASTDRTDGVQLDWEPGDADYQEHDYEVEIIFPADTSERSASAVGYRDVEIDRYDLSIDGGVEMDLGDATSYFDEDADKAGVADVSPEVADTAWDFVTVEVDEAPDITEADEHDYEVTLVTTDNEESDPGEATGQRDYGDAEYGWDAADEDSSDDDDFDVLVDCDGQMTCVDEDFPVETEIAERFYRFVVDGEGIEWTASETVAGQVDPLEVAVDDLENHSFAVGESIDLDAWIQSPDGDPVGWSGLELELEFADEGTVEGTVPQTATTDSSGQAGVTVSFEHELQETTVDWMADHPRLETDATTQGPFDIVAGQQASSQTTTLQQRETTTEMLADGQDYTDVEIEVRDEDGNPVQGATIEATTDQGAILECDEFSDQDGDALCTIDADEPGRYDVMLEEPTAASTDEPVTFYATAGDFPEISGDVRDVGVAGDYVVFGGWDLEDEAGDPIGAGATAIVDRATGEFDGELDDEFGEVWALEADGDDLFVLGDAKLARYGLDDGDFSEEATNTDDAGDLLAIGDEDVFVFDSGDVGAAAYDDDDLTEVDSTMFDLLDSGELFAARTLGNVGMALGDGLNPDMLGGDEFHIMGFVPGDGEYFELETDDVEGDPEFFEIGTVAGFVAGDFTEITGVEVDGLARLTEDGGEMVADDGFVPGSVAEVDGGLLYDDGTLWSAGLFDDGGGQAFDAETGDLEGYELDNDAAWGEIVDAPRHLLLVDDLEGEADGDYDVVIRPDVESAVIGD